MGLTIDQTEHEAKIRRICTNLIDAVCERGECEFVREIAAPLPLIMIGDMLGMPEEDFGTLLRWSEDMLMATNAKASDEVRARASKAGLEWFQYAMGAVAARREKPTDDLVSLLVHGVLGGDRLNDEEIMHETLLILVGGDETTRHVITEGTVGLFGSTRIYEQRPNELATRCGRTRVHPACESCETHG